MKTAFKRIKHTIFLYLYRNVIAANDLKQAVKNLEQTAKSVEATIINQQKTLVEIAASARYLAASEKAELQRKGHPHQFAA